jgi:4-amino-4-deoxy-L-arabinose transferase-like glycosyltransferase
MNAARRDGAWVALVALGVRLALVAWAGARFPPAGDGVFYDTFARRIAHGDGYTWAWPDGVVTFAAHYPVGYPALIAPFYAALGAHPAVAMLVNAALGAAASLAVHRVLTEGAGRGAALAGALIVALHPALVPYTAALMTEGATTALLAIATAVGVMARGRERPAVAWILAGITLGIATLVRPQCVVLAPVLGALAVGESSSIAARARSAAVVTVVALACVAPWTVRNCVRMNRCALVSVNGGWNLLIGAQTASGAWAPVDVPDECKTVWDEAAKDACFDRAARRAIAAAPGAWLARSSAKLGTTFDYFGAAPWYLHLANGDAFTERAKTVLGAVETVVSRLALLAALLAVALYDGPRLRVRQVLLGVAAIAAITLHAWIAYVALGIAVLLLGPRALARAPLVLPWTALLILSTAAIHAAFFGAGRYGLVVVPFVTALAFVRAKPIPPVACASSASSASNGSSSFSRAA